MDHRAPSNPRARAHICHAGEHTKLRFGPRLPHLNPDCQVPNQNEPTDAHPVSEHKQFKGHKAGSSSHIRQPHLKGQR
jgi:hypothetical protein